jgi:hypothetical protein
LAGVKHEVIISYGAQASEDVGELSFPGKKVVSLPLPAFDLRQAARLKAARSWVKLPSS